MHRIARLRLELTYPDEARARDLLARGAELHERRLAPLLEPIFDELDDPTQLLQIDRLELDLGLLSGDLDEELPRRLAPLLRDALRRALAGRPPAAPAARALELLGLFARTGAVPWWIDRDADDPIEGALRRALTDAPRDLAELLRGLALDPAALARLARACDDELRRLARALADDLPDPDHRAALRLLAPGPDPPAPPPEDMSSRTSVQAPEPLATTRDARPSDRTLDAVADGILRAADAADADRVADLDPSPRRADLDLAHHAPGQPLERSLSREPRAPSDRTTRRDLADERRRDHTSARDPSAKPPLLAPPDRDPLEANALRDIPRDSSLDLTAVHPKRPPLPPGRIPTAPRNTSHDPTDERPDLSTVASLFDLADDPSAAPDGSRPPADGSPTRRERPAPSDFSRVSPTARFTNTTTASHDPEDPSASERRDPSSSPSRRHPTDPSLAEPLDSSTASSRLDLANSAPLHPSSSHSRLDLADSAPLHPSSSHSRLDLADSAPLGPFSSHSRLDLADSAPLHPSSSHSRLDLADSAPLHPSSSHSRLDFADSAPLGPSSSHSRLDLADSAPLGPSSSHDLADPERLDLADSAPLGPSSSSHSRLDLADSAPLGPSSSHDLADPERLDPATGSSGRLHRPEHPHDLDSPTLREPADLSRPEHLDLSPADARLDPAAPEPLERTSPASRLDLSPADARLDPAPPVRSDRTYDATAAGPPPQPTNTSLDRPSDASSDRSHEPAGEGPSTSDPFSSDRSNAPTSPARPAAGRSDRDRPRGSVPDLAPPPPSPDARSGSPTPGRPAASDLSASDRPQAPVPVPAPRARPTPAAERARREVLARASELHLESGGLVLLWPFYARLFERLDLLDDARRFRHDRAQIEAVVLLHYLATADPEPLEFRLGLPKLLCGRPLAEPCDLGGPLSPAAQAEGDHLLAALRDHLPALGDAPADALRAHFLQRPASLDIQGGAWLLRVQRRPHDALLAHLPWAWAWLRLPWMPSPVCVEW